MFFYYCLISGLFMAVISYFKYDSMKNSSMGFIVELVGNKFIFILIQFLFGFLNAIPCLISMIRIQYLKYQIKKIKKLNEEIEKEMKNLNNKN